MLSVFQTPQAPPKRTHRHGLGAAGIGLVAVIVAIVFVGLVVFFGVKSLNGKDQAATSQDSSGAVIAPLTIEKTAFSKTPKDIQRVVYDYTAQKEPSCVKNGQIVDSTGNPFDQTITYALSEASSTAITSVGCNGGNKVLFVKKDGVWQAVASGRLFLKCTELTAANVPIRLLSTFNAGQPNPNSCQGDNSQDIKEYTN